MLIKCTECADRVSDKALFCPHCGYPFTDYRLYKTENYDNVNGQEQKKEKTSHKYRRLPNGFGQITEIKGRNLRNPFRVMVSVGKKENGKLDCRLLKPKAYFKTYNEAYQALVEYNKEPYDISSPITMNDLFEYWSKYHKLILKTENSRKAIDSLWAYCSEIYDMNVSEVRPKHLKSCIDNACITVSGKKREASPITKRRMKELFNMLFDYAVEYEITNKNHSRIFTLSPEIREQEEKQKKSHISFTENEMRRLKENVNAMPDVDMLLIQCYSGWRPNELLSLEMENMDVDEGYFIGGMKTKAGTDRKVPIHPYIMPFVKKRYETAAAVNSKYLFPADKSSTHINYHSYDRIYKRIVKQLDLDPQHRPHDCRVQFITMLKNAGADEYAIKYLAGHKISDITENIYTKRDPEWLRNELEKIR